MSVYKQPGSPFWWAEFQIKGKRYRESTGLPHATTSKTGAKAEEAEMKKRAKERLKHGVTTAMTLLDAFKRYGETVVDKGTSDGRTYRYNSARIADWFGPATILDDITEKMIVDFRDELSAKGRRYVASGKGRGFGPLATSRTKGLKHSSVNAYLGLLRTVMRRAKIEWHTLAKLPHFAMAKDPMAKQKQGRHRKPPRFLSVGEEQKLMIASPFYLRQFMEFLLGTGARKTEAITLTWDQIDNLDLDPEAGPTSPFGAPIDEHGQPYARVRFEHVPEEGRKTKMGKWREVPLPEHVRLLLIRMKDAQKARGYTGKRVFLGRARGGRIWQETKSMNSTFDTARMAAGLDAAKQGERITQHSLRHTYASRLVMAGVSLDRVRDLLGHESIEQTEVYAKLAPTTLVTAVAVLSKYAPKPLATGKLKAARAREAA